ncbi:cullin-1 [Trifolium repens]|nr:cullin-1 [Trifolium repens]
MSNNVRRTISLEEGLDTIQKVTNKLQNILEYVTDPHLELSTSDNCLERMNIYTITYNMCNQRDPYDYSQQLYENYKKTFEDYIKSNVLPSLREKKDEILLRELLRRWSNHKTMTIWLTKCFHYLDRYHIPRKGLPSLEEIGFLSFYHLVYNEMDRQVMDAILSMSFFFFKRSSLSVSIHPKGFATFLKFYNMSNIDWSIISYDEGWDYIQNKGIKKLLQSLPNPRFTSEDCSMLYTNVHNMCTQKAPHDYSNKLYEQYKETFKDYITSTVSNTLFIL